MNENVFLLNQENDGLTKSEFLLATIVTADGTTGMATVLLDGMSAPNVKAYKALSSAWPLTAGDRVVLMKMSGTYLVMGKIGNDSGPQYEPAFSILPISKGGTGQNGTSSTSRTSDVITAASGITISTAIAYKWGKIAQLYISAKATSASTAYEFTVGTLKNDWKPATSLMGAMYAVNKTFAIQANGEIKVYAQREADMYYGISGTYILQ